MAEAKTNPNVLDNPEKVKLLNNVLKTNVSSCTSVGPFFFPQLGRIFMDMLGLYKEVSNIINTEIATGNVPSKYSRWTALIYAPCCQARTLPLSRRLPKSEGYER